MSERFPSDREHSYELLISQSSDKPDRAVYSIDDDIVVAAVNGNCVQLFDGDGLAEEFDCDSPEAAKREAMSCALFLQRPPRPPREAQ